MRPMVEGDQRFFLLKRCCSDNRKYALGIALITTVFGLLNSTNDHVLETVWKFCKWIVDNPYPICDHNNYMNFSAARCRDVLIFCLSWLSKRSDKDHDVLLSYLVKVSDPDPAGSILYSSHVTIQTDILSGRYGGRVGEEGSQGQVMKGGRQGRKGR